MTDGKARENHSQKFLIRQFFELERHKVPQKILRTSVIQICLKKFINLFGIWSISWTVIHDVLNMKLLPRVQHHF